MQFRLSSALNSFKTSFFPVLNVKLEMEFQFCCTLAIKLLQKSQLTIVNQCIILKCIAGSRIIQTGNKTIHPILRLGLKNFFYQMFLISSEELKSIDQNRKWNYPNRKWNYSLYFQASDQITNELFHKFMK